MGFKKLGLTLAAVALVWGKPVVCAESGETPAAAGLTTAQIVDAFERRDEAPDSGLKHYRAVRHYEVGYKGLVQLGAKMEVEVTYDSASGKSFRIVSQTGSKMLIEKVLKRLIETEKEAGSNRKSNQLSSANYAFQPLGSESISGRPAYILRVDPRSANKLLYRGKVWIDAEDFAIVKIEAEPAKNPSFWIAKTQIRQTFSKTSGFWLPQQNRSESEIRIGGRAVLTIDYGTYQVQSAAPSTAGN
jgi:hypothetical protein